MKDKTLVEKYWGLDFQQIKGGDSYFFTECYKEQAETIEEAKNKLFDNVIKRNDLRFLDGSIITIENMPIIRLPKLDKYLFGKYVMTNARNNQINTILSNDNVTHYHIFCRGSSDVDFYYVGNGKKMDLTESKDFAGVYPKEVAADIVRADDTLELMPIDTEKHNKKIRSIIKALELNLIV